MSLKHPLAILSHSRLQPIFTITLEFEIQMPSLCSSLSSACSILSTSSNLDGTLTCSRSSNSKSFYVDSPFASDGDYTWDYKTSTDGSTLTVKISSASNPVSAKSASSWKIITYNYISGSYYQVDSGSSSSSFTSTSGTLSESGTGISSSSGTTYDDTSLITFSIALSHYIPASGYVEITLPTEMSVSSSASVRSSCYYSSSKISQTCSVSSNVILMQLSTLTTSHLASSVFYISFYGIRTPRTFKESSSFTIET